jgi:hypothetical protein
MNLFGKKTDAKVGIQRANAKSKGNIRFASTLALEQLLDGTESTFEEYFFAIYHCSYFEKSGIKERREQLANFYPNNVIKVGKFFVLDGEAAFSALSSYYQVLVDTETLDDEFKDYISKRLFEIEEAHKSSQSLRVPINLTEGMLSNDKQLNFFTCLAIDNGQVLLSSKG